MLAYRRYQPEECDFVPVAAADEVPPAPVPVPALPVRVQDGQVQVGIPRRP